MHATRPLLIRGDFPRIRRRTHNTPQLSLGCRCNLTILEEPGQEDRAEHSGVVCNRLFT